MSHQRAGGNLWNFPPGVYSASQVIVLVSPLLETVIASLGPDSGNGFSARKELVDGLEASLSTQTRESTMPMSRDVTDVSRIEMGRQAVKVGKYLVQLVDDLSSPDMESNVVIDSDCEGYVWTRRVSDLLRGPRSNGRLLQVYNEWLHQIVLLRDALLPFENFAETQLCIQCRSGPGLRDFEDLRSKFIHHCLTRTVSQSTLVDVSKAFTAPTLPLGGYGLQYSQGVILPAFLSGSSSLHLLKYHAARLDTSGLELLFEYEYENSPAAPRTEICGPIKVISPGTWPAEIFAATLSPEVEECAMVVENPTNNKRQPKRLLQLRLRLEGGIGVSVDLGQIARGRRFAYQVAQNGSSSRGASGPGLSKPSALQKTTAVLTQPGIVTSRTAGMRLIPAEDPVLRLALLGKLYPENVVMLPAGSHPRKAEELGKSHGPKFILYGGSTDRELLCPLQAAEDRFSKS